VTVDSCVCVCSLVTLTATPLHGSATGILCLVSVHTVLGLHAMLFTFCVSVLQCSDLVFLVVLKLKFLTCVNVQSLFQGLCVYVVCLK
jgi:hypothetical protein